MLDDILLDYIHTQKNQLKLIKKLKRLIPEDPDLHKAEIIINNRIKFYYSMVENKEKKFKKRLNIKRTVNKIYYMVKFVYFFKILLKRKKKHEKEPSKIGIISDSS